MFESLFASKNKKLVLTWNKEHEKIVALAHKIIAAYTSKDEKKVRKHLIALRSVALNHLMAEDIAFNKLLKDEKRVTDEIAKSVNDFTDSFHATKTVLRDFFRQYVQENAVYDETFFTTFNSLVEALGQRIAYEEKHLYKILKEK